MSGSLRHMVWLQRSDGHAETKHNPSVQKLLTRIKMRPRQVDRFSFLTFSVFRPYLRDHFLLAAHPQQPPFLGRGSLVHVLCEAVHLLGAPRKESSPTNNRAPGRLILPGESAYRAIKVTYLAGTGAGIDRVICTAVTVGQTGSLFPMVASLVSTLLT